MSKALSSERYSSVAAILHWTIAALILGQIAGGLYMHNLPSTSPIKFDLFQLHKSFGLSVLALALVRLGWRLTHKAPPLPAATPGWQKLAARAVHWAFYALMILTPLAGLAIVSVSPLEIPTKWFGIIPVPHLPFFGGETSRALEDVMKERHEFLAFAILYLLGLHVAAALKHQFFDKDGVFSSILPEKKRHWMGAGAIVAVLAAGAAFYLLAPGPRIAAAGAVMPEHSHGDAATVPADEKAHHGADDSVYADDHEHGAGSDHDSDSASVGDPTANTATQKANKSAKWAVNYAASHLKFFGMESGETFEGGFSDYKAVISFDPDDLAHAKIDVTVTTSSAAAGSDLRDSSLPGGEWFDVKNHPAATFASTAVRKAGAGYEADGVLTIKEFKKPVTLIFDLTISGDDAVATGHADLIRTDFGLGEASSWVDDEGVALEVRVEFEIHAARAN